MGTSSLLPLKFPIVPFHDILQELLFIFKQENMPTYFTYGDLKNMNPTSVYRDFIMKIMIMLVWEIPNYIIYTECDDYAES